METILSIKKGAWSDGGWSPKEGYVIATDKQEIRIGISSTRECCEDWGCLISEDDVSEFIGANLLSISLTNTALNTQVMERLGEACVEAHEVMFVTIETTVGPLQFAVYNSHNGYYGHSVGVWSKQLTHEDCL